MFPLPPQGSGILPPPPLPSAGVQPADAEVQQVSPPLQVHSSGLRLGDKLMRWPGAPWLPVIQAVSFLSLITLTMYTAISLGHVKDLRIPAVSPSTRLNPEYLIWTGGVVLTIIFISAPMAIVAFRALRVPLHEVPKESIEGLSWFCVCDLCIPSIGLGGYCIAGLGLVLLACIPMQKDVLEEDAELNTQTIVHLVCASVFFLAMFITNTYVVIWQWSVRCCCSFCLEMPVRRIGLFSLMLKTIISVLTLFGGIIGYAIAFEYLHIFYPDPPPSDEEVMTNGAGCGQRVTIALLVLFLATFALDIKVAQEEALEPPVKPVKPELVGQPVMQAPPATAATYADQS